ncbi:MAG TPA: ester cyclase [Chloroflexia bacterium]|jgi:predicted ester cyclase|nr:ester cyclase [Chloroflexia bacterium]
MPVAANTTALPEVHLTVEQLIDDGDLVYVRLRGEATPPGAATPLTWTENELLWFENGRIVASWQEANLAETLAAQGWTG